jgi:hypothetical protein
MSETNTPAKHLRYLIRVGNVVRYVHTPGELEMDGIGSTVDRNQAEQLVYNIQECFRRDFTQEELLTYADDYPLYKVDLGSIRRADNGRPGMVSADYYCTIPHERLDPNLPKGICLTYSAKNVPEGLSASRKPVGYVDCSDMVLGTKGGV